MCFILYNDTEYFRSFVLKDKKTNAEYPKYLEISFLELFKGSAQLEKTNMISCANCTHTTLSAKDQWILFLTTQNKEVQQNLAQNNTTLHAAYERLTTVSSDEKLRAIALNREKALRDWNSSIHYAEQHGKQHEKEQINTLNQYLITDNRFDDLKRSINDPDFQQQLLKEYGIEG